MSTKPLKLGDLSLFVQETARQKMNGVGYFSFFFFSSVNQSKVARNHHAPMVIYTKNKEKITIFLHSKRDVEEKQRISFPLKTRSETH